MGSLFIIILLVVILIIWYSNQKECFEVWPVPMPEELGAPTPPKIMNFDERVAKGEIIAPPVAEIRQEQKYELIGGSDLYGGYGPAGTMGVYPMYRGMQFNPLFGGNTSGSASIGGFGPVAPSGMLTPAAVKSMTAAMTAALTAPATVPAMTAPATVPAMTAPATVPAMTAALTAPATPAAVSTIQAPAAVGGGGSRAKTAGPEVDIKGYDWTGLAAQSATAFEPVQAAVSAPVQRPAPPPSPFETVAAGAVEKEPIETPIGNQQRTDVGAAKDTPQSLFGSVDMPNILAQGENRAPLFAANAPVSALRGSINQPGNILGDSRSTKTVIDTEPGRVAVALPPQQTPSSGIVGA